MNSSTLSTLPCKFSRKSSKNHILPRPCSSILIQLCPDHRSWRVSSCSPSTVVSALQQRRSRQCIGWDGWSHGRWSTWRSWWDVTRLSWGRCPCFGVPPWRFLLVVQKLIYFSLSFRSLYILPHWGVSTSKVARGFYALGPMTWRVVCLSFRRKQSRRHPTLNPN